MKKKTSPYQLNAAREPTLRIYSYGHSGTGYLKRLLRSSTSAYLSFFDPEQNPHAKFYDIAETKLQEVKKAIVIYADPREAAISLFSKSDERIRRHCELMGAPVAPNMRMFWLSGSVFTWRGFQEFYYSWFNSDIQFDVAFVKYENLIEDESLRQLRDFAEVQEPEANFMQRAKREYNPRLVRRLLYTSDQRERLDKMFEDLLADQNKLPPFWIKKKIK